MNIVPNNEQNIHYENSTAEIQNNIQGSSNTVNIHYPTTKEPELEDFNFPKPIDSFKGRQNEFKHLDDCLFLNDQKMVVIWGLPGFGKSELVKQFAQKCKDNRKIKHICWIQASNKDDLKNSLKDLVKILELPDVDKLRVLLQIVSKRYEKSETLFVFDDVDSPWTLLDWETPNSCWTLVSSQLGEWGTTPCAQMGPLDHDAAVAVLQHQQDPIVIADPELRTLATLLDNAPLALQLAGAYIRQEKKLFPKKFTISEYIRELQTSLEKIVNEQLPAHTFLPYEYRIQEAMNLSLEKIRNLDKFESNLALHILNIIAYLNQHNILQNTLLEFSLIQNKLKEKVEDPERILLRALYVLQSYSFVHLEDSFIRIHSLVQHTVIFYHNEPNADIDSYYISCLKFVLDNNYNWHSTAILKHADKKQQKKIFKKFYDEHESSIIYENKANSTNEMKVSISHILKKLINTLPLLLPELDHTNKFNSKNTITSSSFLGKLVVANAKECLSFIFGELGSQAKKVIIDQNLLLYVIETQEPDMIKLLQTYEKDIIQKTGAGDHHILYYSTSSIDKLNFLLEHSNINVNARSEKGNTCIYDLLRCTLVSDPRLQHINRRDKTCEIMHALVNHGASVYDVTNDGGYSVLHAAVNMIETAMRFEVAEFIVNDLQVDVNKRTIYGSTALQLILYRRAAQEIDDELTSKVVDVLVRRGAAVHIKYNCLDSPLNIIEKFQFHFLLPIVSFANLNR